MKQKVLIIVLILAILLLTTIGILFSAFDFKLKHEDFERKIVYAYSDLNNEIELKDNNKYSSAEVLSYPNFENTYNFSVSSDRKRGEYIIELKEFDENTYNGDSIMVYLEKNGKPVMNPTKFSDLSNYTKNSKLLYKCLYGSKEDVTLDEYVLKIWVSNESNEKQDNYFYKIQVNVL